MTENRSTLLLEVVDSAGDACWRGLDRVELQSTPAHTFDEWQSGDIPVNVAHQPGTRIGVVDYLESGVGHGDGGIYAVAVVDVAAELVHGLFASPEITCDALHVQERHSYRLDRRRESFGTLTATRSTLDGVGLVARTAGVTSTRVQAWRGDYRDPIDWGAIVSRRPPEILLRAKAAARYDLRTSRPHKLRIHRPADHGVVDELEVRSGRVELRTTGWYPGVLAVRASA